MLLPLFLLSSIFSFCCAFENYEIVDSDGNVHTYSEYIKKNQFLLIVNVASECGFTDQYFGLEEMYLKMQENDIELEILAFPCNQFGGQEPMEYGHQIQTFVQDTFEVTFPIMDKIEVNGKDAHPLFLYLQEALGGTITNAIKWNFTKFLIINGVPWKRYASSITPRKIQKDIMHYIKTNTPQHDAL